jgi:hypothetical protein
MKFDVKKQYKEPGDLSSMLDRIGPAEPIPSYSGGYTWTILDNMYSIGRDDDEILEILMILFNLIE